MNMMKFAVLIFFPLLLLECSHSDRDKNISKERSKSEVVMIQQISFIGRLPELPSPAMRCGDNAIAVVYKFEIVKFLKGKLDARFLGLIIPCPELKGEGFFEKGGTYQITATSELGEAEGYAVVNDYENEKLPMFWVQEIEKAE